MRLEKLTFDRGVGQAKDESWISVSEADQGYELAVRTNLLGEERYTEWNNIEIPESQYNEEDSVNTVKDYSSADGSRILNPGTSRENQSQFSLTEDVYEGLLGEIQAATVYDRVRGHIDEETLDLYDFVEWFQDEPNSEIKTMIELGPEATFRLENSGIKTSLDNYLERHVLDGAELQRGINGPKIGEIPDNRNESILRQTGLQAENGILTKNPEEVRRVVNEK